MKVIPETVQALAEHNPQAVLEHLTVTWPPDDKACKHDSHKRQCTRAHNHLAPEDTAILWTGIHEPAMQTAHLTEERQALGLSFNLAGILVYIHCSTARFGDIHLIGLGRIGRYYNTCNLNTIGKPLLHPCNEGCQRERFARRLHAQHILVIQCDDITLEHQQRAGKADYGNDYAEWHRNPQMQFLEKLVHITTSITLLPQPCSRSFSGAQAHHAHLACARHPRQTVWTCLP